MITQQPFFSSSYNSSMFSLHGILVCLGLILYSIGSKAIPAAELTLLSLTEVVGGIFWVWLPLFGINEVPSSYTVTGGFFLFISLIYYSLIMNISIATRCPHASLLLPSQQERPRCGEDIARVAAAPRGDVGQGRGRCARPLSGLSLIHI